jgi:hypothetical protein
LVKADRTWTQKTACSRRILYNQQLPQSALRRKAPLQAMKDWHKLKPKLFKKQPYYLTGCDSYASDDDLEAVINYSLERHNTKP